MGLFDINVYIKPDPEVLVRLGAIQRSLDLIRRHQEIIMSNQADVKAKLAAILADVGETRGAMKSMSQVLDNLSQLNAELKARAVDADVDATIVADIDALGAAISENKQAILADIAKNSPPETPPA